ncbi:methylenetetrahydrofolate reductase [Olsenella profusa]|uniref:Methylenetetrahydrofolate reductase n=1 Tax=Olsenella profusa TaxID=138595 RepID=A0ABS2F3S6_9ACTN|nr:methylenetetrahydrofolate reductase [Olsenella profusa]MBM6775545.1 methylenetetrahydrofolate reductase [Olsenella profusa]
MKIIDKLATRQTFSFEIFPPKGDLPLETACQIAGEMASDRPDWISVTYSAGGSGNSANTVPIAAQVEHGLGVTALAHLTCLGSTRADVDAYVHELADAGVENVLALRGDRRPGREERDFAHASDLISYLRTGGSDLCIGAACYPEGHIESADECADFQALYLKQEAGADYLVSQLFFDNEGFYRFREKCLRHRVRLPIVAGIMPFTSVKQIQRMAFTCGASIPAKVVKRLALAGEDPADQARAGIEYACEQLEDLAANGVDGLHVYSMNKPAVAHAAHEALAACGYLEA